MPRHLILVLVGCAAIAGLWWLVAGDETGQGALGSVGVVDPEAGGEAGSPGLAPSERPGAEGIEATRNPYADISDLRDLLVPLNGYRSAAAAAERAGELIGGDADRIRELLRLLHPSQGRGNLSAYATQRAITTLLTGIGDPALEVLIAELDDPHAVYRTQIDALIGGFGARAARAVPRLLKQLRDVPEDPPSAEAASVVNALGAIGSASVEVLPELETWLSDGVTEVLEVAAAGAVVRIGGATERTWDTCRELLAETSWSAQRQANLQALGGLGAEAAPMIPVLLDYVDEGVLDAGSAFHVLRQIGVPDARLVANLKAGLLETESLELALGLHGATLVRLGEGSRRAAYAVLRERGLLAQAHLPLAFAGTREDIPWDELLREMEPAMGAPDAEVRLRAAHSFSHLNEVPDSVRQRLARWALADESAPVRLSGIWIAANTKELDSALAALLLELVKDADETIENATTAADALARKSRWRNDALYRALRALQLRHPSNLEVLMRFIPFAESHAAEVLALWDAGIKSRVGSWGWYLAGLQRVPADALKAYPGAVEVLKVQERQRR